MSGQLQPVRGTRDLYGPELKSMLHIVEQSRQVAEHYGFEDFETPIFESTDVFKRTLGDTSDIVTKEMYTFEDKGGDFLTLRPEGTAGIARAAISNGMLRETPLKFFYHGPMFRHERPQKGRYRQFYQMGVELLGVASPLADAEVIAMGWAMLKKLGLGENVTLELNTLGDTESRKAYRETLTLYFKSCQGSLSPDSIQRIDKNPLRILDSKAEQDQDLIAKAPKFSEHLNAESKEFFSQVREYLDALKIPYKINEKLVRGLDYYSHTVFEFTTTDLGAQNAVLSGGRYDGLIKMMGGAHTPGVGWAAGLDRLALLMKPVEKKNAVIGVVPFDDTAETPALVIAQKLRDLKIPTRMPYSGNLSKRFKKLDRENCLGAIVVFNENPLRYEFKDFSSGTQTTMEFSAMMSHIQNLFPQSRS